MKASRTITVSDHDYLWVLTGNSTYGKEQHIRVYRQGCQNSILYIDPYAWDFEVRPRQIREAILFALQQGWDPEEGGSSFYIGMRDGELIILPDGVQFAYKLPS